VLRKCYSSVKARLQVSRFETHIPNCGRDRHMVMRSDFIMLPEQTIPILQFDGRRGCDDRIDKYIWKAQYEDVRQIAQYISITFYK
jgi:hypothetical protein